MQVSDLWSAFSDIDGQSEPEKLALHLEAMAAVPALAAGKRRSLELLELQPGMRVLDVGCGSGVDLPDICAAVCPGGVVCGIDNSGRLLKRAAARCAGLADLTLRRADAAELPLADAEFDVVRADRSLQHHRRPTAALREMRRVARPGGRVAITEVYTIMRGEWSELSARLNSAIDQLDAENGPGWIGDVLPVLIARAGMDAPTVDVTTARLGSFAELDRALSMSLVAEQLVSRGYIGRDASRGVLQALSSDLESGRGRAELSTVTFLITVA